MCVVCVVCIVLSRCPVNRHKNILQLIKKILVLMKNILVLMKNFIHCNCRTLQQHKNLGVIMKQERVTIITRDGKAISRRVITTTWIDNAGREVCTCYHNHHTYTATRDRYGRRVFAY